MTVRVVLDATAMPGQRVGAGVYVVELLRALDAPDVDLHVFANVRDAADLSHIAGSATVHGVRAGSRPARLLWSHSIFPMRVRRLRPHVFHGTHYVVPAGIGCAGVVTFHDPTFYTHPDLHERAKVAYFTRAIRGGVDRASRVIAVSEYARRGAVSHAGADPDRVDVVYEGVDLDRYRPAVERQAPAEPYVLFVGALEPRKDVPTLVGAYAEVAKKGFPHHLVLTGPPRWGTDAVEAAIAAADAGTIRRTGFVSDDEKIALYQGASAFVYPSIAEGFGLPVLEAMACGTPVITTTGSAPEEIAGDAALLVPPRDGAALRDAILRVLTEDALAADLRRRGPERAKAFTWKRAAAETVDVWRRAAR